LVDVREVASAHVLAMTAEGAAGRYILAAGSLHMQDVTKLLQEEFGNYGLPKRNLLNNAIGTAIVKVAVNFGYEEGVASYLKSNLGKVFQFDNTKAIKDLNIKFTDPTISLVDTCRDLILKGHLPEKRVGNNL